MTFESLLVIVLLSFGGSLFLLEQIPSFQKRTVELDVRLIANLGIFILGSVILSLFFPVGPYATALQTTGLLSNLDLPLGGQIILVFLFLDFWRYWEHRIFHKVPLLWRAHLVHHSDTYIDITTSQRHHPLEALITTPMILLFVLALGLPAEGIATYILVAIVSSLWVHSNLRFPVKLDSVLRKLIVTPAVHAVHHSSLQQETDSNYGSILTIWDRLFGTYYDPSNANIRHYGLEYFHQAKDCTLMRALLQPILYRVGMPYPMRADEPKQITSAKSSVLSHTWQQTLTYGSLGLILVCLAMWPTFINLTSIWSSSEPYQYAWLVLPFLFYMLGWHYRDEMLSLSPQTDLLGIIVIAAAVGLWLVATIVQIDLGLYVAFVLVLQGILISALGRHIWWQFVPIFALLFFMIPSGDILQLPLRSLTVNAIEIFANVANLPYSIDGFVVYIGEQRYVVVDACSGLTFVTLATFLAYSFGTLLYRSISKVLGLALIGGMLGICANVFRVNTIVWLDWINGTEMDLTEHTDIQLIALILLLGTLFLLVSRLQPESNVGEAQHNNKRLDATQNWRRYTSVFAGLIVVSTIGLAQLTMDASQAESHFFSTELTAVTPGIHSTNQKNPEWVFDEKSRIRSLQMAFDQELDVLIVQALPGNKKLPESWLTPRGENNWREVNIEKQLACQHEDCINFIHTTWNTQGSDDVRHIFYAYHVGEMVTDSKLTYRIAAGWNRLIGANQKAGFISFFFVGEPPAPKKLASAYLQIKMEI